MTLLRKPSDKNPNRNGSDDYSPMLESKFINLIEQKSGIVLDNIKRKEIKQNIVVCMEEIKETSFSRYYSRLIAEKVAGIELKKLINFITINETFFFRVPEHFAILENVVIPQLIEKKQNGRIAVWSAGASSGEEVYSIIITLLNIPDLKDKFRFDVLGTDINEDMLYIARKGIYRGRTINKVPSFLLQKYFEPFAGDRFRVKDEVRQLSSFHYLNLAQPFDLDFFGKADIIFFRNVLIYFNTETTRRIIDSFYDLLNDGGYLIIGPSETLWEISDKFQLMMFDNAFIYRKKSAAELAETLPSTASSILSGSTGAITSQSQGILKESERSIQPVETTEPVSVGTLPAMPEDSKPSMVKETSPNTRASLLSTVTPTATSLHDTPKSASSEEEAFFPTIGERIRIKLEEVSLAVLLGEYGKAEELLDDVLSVEPGNKQAILLKMTLFCNQEEEEALLIFASEIRRMYPIFPELHFILGRFYEIGKKPRKAAKEYNKILFVDPLYLMARERLLKILHETGDTKQAQREARNITDQLATGNYKEFENSVGETIDKDRLQALCRLVLN